jgi:hypothetical protein
MEKQKLISRLKDLKNGQLEGGFVVLMTTNHLLIGGVTDPVNNCQGGQCQTNNCSGGNCGNCVFACGTQA